MNFENKQFKLGRFYERIYLCIQDFAIGEQMDFINGVSRELEVQLTDELALACVHLSYIHQTSRQRKGIPDVVKYKRKKYYMFGNWNNLDTEEGDLSILYIKNGKLEKMCDVSVVFGILKICGIEVEEEAI
jgi:hypothetical protein